MRAGFLNHPKDFRFTVAGLVMRGFPLAWGLGDVCPKGARGSPLRGAAYSQLAAGDGGGGQGGPWAAGSPFNAAQQQGTRSG